MNNPHLTPKEEEILAELKSGKDPCKIAEARGCRTTYLYKVAAKAGFKMPPRRRGPKPNLSSETVNSLHAQIGRDLYAFRNKLDYVSYREFAPVVGMSVANYQKAESGLHKFELVELQRIADVLGVSLQELVTLRPNRFEPLKDPK